MAPKVIELDEILKVTDGPGFDKSLVDAIATGFADFSAWKFNVCPIQTMGAPPMAPMVATEKEKYAAQMCVKSGYFFGDSHFTIKVASGGFPWSNSGQMLVFSQATGKLEAILLDEGILTELRTAAAGAVAVQQLARGPISKIGMIGTGVQARYQLRYMKQVTECRELILWGRTKENVSKLQEELEGEGWTVEVTETPDSLMDQCNVVITTTTAREAVVSKVPTKIPTLIICIGADSVGKQELGVGLVKAADVLVCDSRLQTRERGEFQHALKDGLVSLDNVSELGEIVDGGNVSLPDSPLITIFDSSGVAFQDCVVSKLVHRALATTSTSEV